MLLIGSSALAWLSLQSRPQTEIYQSARLFPQPRPIEPFRLVDQHGQPFTPERLTGQWNLLFFGYTHCPDVCPDTLARAAQAIRLLEQDGQPKPSVWFISVDPERDEPQRLADYVHYFHEDFHAATGKPAQLEAFSRSLAAIYFIGEPDENGHYDVDHSANLLILDPRGRLAGMFRPPFDPQAMAWDLQKLQEEGS